MIVDQDMLQNQALRDILSSEELARPFLAGLAADDPLRTATEEQCRLLDER